MYDYIIKPFDIKNLVECIEKNTLKKKDERKLLIAFFRSFYRTKSIFPIFGFDMTLRCGMTGAVGFVRRSGREVRRFGD